MTGESFTADELDHQLIHALQLDPRLPFARFAQLVGVSEQTVARRFRRLRSGGVVRVVGMVDPAALGESTWIVRIQSRPDAAVSLADALASRDDVGWVTLTSGGSEILCMARSRTSAERDELLLQRLPKTAQVTGFSAQAMLHRFDDPASWSSGQGRLTDEQVKTLLAAAVGGGVQSADTRTPSEQTPSPPVLSTSDEALLIELAKDGRTPVARLAGITGWSASRVGRRLDELVEWGLLYFDVEVSLEALGFRAQAFVWLTVGPADLETTGKTLAKHPEIAFVAASTGSSNLIAAAFCRDSRHLYRYVTEGLGGIGALRQLEISPVLRRVKQNGSRMKGDRIVIPAG
jgi:DNA-binding Lrp family transcriptional regulator